MVGLKTLTSKSKAHFKKIKDCSRLRLKRQLNVWILDWILV